MVRVWSGAFGVAGHLPPFPCVSDQTTALAARSCLIVLRPRYRNGVRRRRRGGAEPTPSRCTFRAAVICPAMPGTCIVRPPQHKQPVMPHAVAPQRRAALDNFATPFRLKIPYKCRVWWHRRAKQRLTSMQSSARSCRVTPMTASTAILAGALFLSMFS